ncbi:STAS domain-containing protein [Georgenia thermotolerans]|uniref:STAS domain-containing protein n=1 Tax=Georgenia thermotolerans TaxID=527326 RepID=A0A7J5USB6_9MICO|nr:STAS domain-containing protein [Georgenia thermotolerans]KAE8765296.1 STAS domain-containing protein [Georgenia thermotolerans]
MSEHDLTGDRPHLKAVPVDPQSDADGSVHLLAAADTTRLVLAGDLDISCSAELRQAISEAVDRGKPVQVDARHVRFMDSSAVAMLAYLAHRSSSRLTMIQPPDVVRFLLEVTNVGSAVEVVEVDPGM